MPTDIQTLRYRAVMKLAYSVALLLLMEYARTSDDDFRYEPLDLVAMEDHGLLISGPDVSGAAKILEGIPGLYLSED